ncbi:MAG: hypothetical protein KDA86_06865 [Planctomycetaceae bacterium]|nr:hypothetical protein [Planctomycetaceae bacterium]
MAFVFALPGELAAQRRGKEFDDYDTRIVEDEPIPLPEKKPNLAERNNITPNPLMTLDEETRFNNHVKLKEYTSSLRSSNPRPIDEQNILEGVRFRVYRMTLPENWENISNARNDLIKDIDLFAKEPGRAKQFALSAAQRYLTELLTDQPRIVTLNAVLALGQLNERPGNPFDKTVDQPYAPAAEPLLSIVEGTNQTAEAKIAAVFGLGRILKNGAPPRTMRDRIAHVLADELEIDPGTKLKPDHVWYLWRIVDTLGYLQEPRTAIDEPVAVDALWKTMLNDSIPPEYWHLRAHAARALSQLDLDNTFDVGLIAHEVVQLGGMVTVQFNRDPTNPVWRKCFIDLYFTYQPQTTEEATGGWGLLQQVKTPALRTHQPLVDGAYQESLKLINGALKNNPPTPVPNSVLNEVSDWMRKNPPTSQKLYAESETVEEIKATAAVESDPNTAVTRPTGLTPAG